MSYLYMEISGFLDELASKAPVPGGGGASALCGALAASLAAMVGGLTVGKKKYASVEEEISGSIERLTSLRGRLCELMDEDAKAFAPLAAAYSMPKDDPERDAVMETCLREAALPPLNIMRTCVQVLEETGIMAEKGSAMAASDAGCAAKLAEAAAYCAMLNVKINTKSMKDRAFAEDVEFEAAGLMARCGKLAGDICGSVEGGLAI